jgi:hypothetical protein
MRHSSFEKQLLAERTCRLSRYTKLESGRPVGLLKIESKTYVGLSVEGCPSLIAELRASTNKLFELVFAKIQVESIAQMALFSQPTRIRRSVVTSSLVQKLPIDHSLRTNVQLNDS